MKMIKFRYSLSQLAFIVLLAAIACKKPSTDPSPSSSNNNNNSSTNNNNSNNTTNTPTIPDRVIYVINEGNFGSSNGSVSLYDPKTNVATNDVFKTVNNRTLGDVVQSMTIINGNSYFVVNNSNKIEIADATTMLSKGVINGLALPRYLVQASSTKAYLSEYVSFSGNGRVSIIDLTTNTVTSSIAVGGLPEHILIVNGKLYVANSNDNTVTVINTSTDAVETTITVAQGPTGLKLDANGKLWVLCEGEIAYDASYNVDPVNSIAGAVVRIDPSTNTVEQTYPFSSKIGSPSNLCINGAKNKLYFFYLSAVYTFDISAGTISSNPLINRNFYGLGVDSTEDKIYAGTYGFTSNQQLIRYSNTGTVLDSVTVGIGPNGFVF